MGPTCKIPRSNQLKGESRCLGIRRSPYSDVPSSLLRPRCQPFANLWTRKNHHRRRGTAATPQWRNHRKPIIVVVAPLPWSSKIGLGSKAIKNNTKKFEIDIDSAEDLFLWMVRSEPFNGWVTLNHKSMDVLTTSKLP